jgi:hypothetical protein
MEPREVSYTSQPRKAFALADARKTHVLVSDCIVVPALRPGPDDSRKTSVTVQIPFSSQPHGHKHLILFSFFFFCASVTYLLPFFVPASQGLGISFYCLAMSQPHRAWASRQFIRNFSSQPHRAWASHFIVLPCPSLTGPGHLDNLSKIQQ